MNELDDDILDTVSGGTGVEVSESAAAEGLYVGVELIVRCLYCQSNTYRLTRFTSDTTFRAKCTHCGYIGQGTLKSCGGSGWDLP